CHRRIARHAELHDEIRHDAEEPVAIEIARLDQLIKALHAFRSPGLVHFHHDRALAGGELHAKVIRGLGRHLLFYFLLYTLGGRFRRRLGDLGWWLSSFGTGWRRCRRSYRWSCRRGCFRWWRSLPLPRGIFGWLRAGAAE